jgi:hypothetical protein
LLNLLADIHEYDQIIIARPDMLSMNMFGTKWKPDMRPGKVTFSGNNDCVNDWVVTTDPAGIATLHDLYYDGINTRDLVDELGRPKIIHSYLHEKIKANPEKFHYGESDGVFMPMPPTVLIRPNYPKAWLKIPYGPLLAYLLVRHYHVFEQTYTDNPADVDELTIQLLRSTDFRI